MSVMPLDDTSFPPSLTTATKNRSLLSKFTTPFASRSRNLFDCAIKLEDPWKSYFPGEIVKGSVIVTVYKPFRVTHLTVCLHGFVKVYRHAITPGDGLAGQGGFLGTGRGRRGGQYLGNGFASLFEDEALLCGEGRLPEGVYEFKFELEFPRNLPSSVDFERGTITYMITSTMTRPTTIAPTTSRTQRVQLLESIDIAPLGQPKPKVISLEPISRRSKVRVKPPRSTSVEQVQTMVAADQASVPKPSRSNTLTSESLPPLSPAPSEISSDRTSTRSLPAAINSLSSHGASAKPTFSDTRSTSTSLSDKTITATTELLRPGALPGDTIPIKIVINHTKRVQSPHGVIVTLYRQGRIDAHPDIPIGIPGKGKKPQYEDYYPKSKTGLGGLSLSSAGSCSVFRKDLSQSFAPLVVDPRDMTAVVKTSIRIPEDAFPTITRVPGSMITFKYYIEVVIDLRGKLAGQERFLPRLNVATALYGNGTAGQRHDVRDENGNPITSWNGSILDTDAIRREKSVVACLFEVIVGSRDSGRSRKWLNEAPAQEAQLYDIGDERSHDEYVAWQQSMTSEEYYLQDEYDYYENDQVPEPYEPDTPTANHLVPPPEPEEQVDEKTRLRRAEEMLFPSRPSIDDPTPAGSSQDVPTAPVLEYDHSYDTYTIYENQPTASSTAAASAPSIDTIVPPFGDDRPPPMPDHHHQQTQDDKHELERQRLMAQASAPDMTGDDDGTAESSQTPAVPTAPILTEEDEYRHVADGIHNVGESLPRYHR